MNTHKPGEDRQENHSVADTHTQFPLLLLLTPSSPHFDIKSTIKKSTMDNNGPPSVFRPRVNGAFLQQFHGKQVCLLANVVKVTN
jgi:hypothetical protein